MILSRRGLVLAVLVIAVVAGLLRPSCCRAQIGPQMSLIRCLDDDVGISLLCSREWPVKRSPLTVTWTVIDRPEEKVNITIEKSHESGLTYDNLVPSALQYVFGYADGFRYGAKKIRGRKMIMVEGVQADNPAMNIIDYFVIDRGRLFRVQYGFSDKDMLYRYRPFFLRILNSLRFER